MHRKGYSFADIFRDYWELFLKDNAHLNIRDTVHQNVERMLNCKTPDLGYAFYECPNCDHYHIAFHTCKSCGAKYTKARSQSVQSILLDCSHRHITFTIPDSLWHYFRARRKRLNLLFESVNMTFKHLLRKHGKAKNYQAGFILVLHTFGRALNFNPHIHCLISEGMVDRSGHFKPLKYFNYELLRKSFMKCLLDLLHQELGNTFYKEKCELYQQLEHGFYVHTPNTSKDFKNHQELTKYVLRYTGRPAMAESRLLDVDDQDMVSYFYEPHEDDHLPENERTGPVEVYEHVYEFIKKLMVHIPDYQFKTIRYYGLYSSVGRQRLPNYQKKLTFLKQLISLKWRNLLLSTFKYDILKCKCGAMMKYIRESSYFP